MFRLSLIPDPFCRLRIHGTLPLCFPVQISSGLCHPVICLSCSPHSFCNICRMCRNLRSHDSLFYIFQIRKGQMLCRCHIAQKCRSCRCCHGSANRRSNMVISGSNIRHKWSQYIKRRSLTNGLLHFHICLDLIQRHMSRTFHHHLNILLPCPPGQFAQTHQLLNLADVRCICKTSWSACVTE